VGESQWNGAADTSSPGPESDRIDRIWIDRFGNNEEKRHAAKRARQFLFVSF
jgi:hypothetical protein